MCRKKLLGSPYTHPQLPEGNRLLWVKSQFLEPDILASVFIMLGTMDIYSKQTSFNLFIFQTEMILGLALKEYHEY